MRITPSQTARLEFLVRVTDKECQHLQGTDGRLFGHLFTIEEAKKIELDPILAERLDAFVSRFGRLQDTVGDKATVAEAQRAAGCTGCSASGKNMKLKFKKQAYQTNAVEVVADCFAGQPKREGFNYRLDPGRAVDASGQAVAASMMFSRFKK